MPIPVSTAPATPEASPRRKADHPVHSRSSPSATSVPSVAVSSSGPAHEGAPATASATARYTDTEAPRLTSTRSASPSPPGDNHITAPAPAAHSATASSSRRPEPYRVLESMASDRRNGDDPPPLANGQVRPLTIVGVDTPACPGESPAYPAGCAPVDRQTRSTPGVQRLAVRSASRASASTPAAFSR
ncbi:hypothetical protein GCM10022420_033890 [Streptomyces iranensis]